MGQQPVIIVGAGGHGRVIADILDGQVLGFLDDHAVGKVDGYPVLGKLDDAPRFNGRFILGIGDNATRKRLAPRFPHYGTAVDVSTVVSASAVIGEGTVIMPQVAVNAGARIGRHVILNTGCTVDHDCVIGDYVHVAPGVHLCGNVHIGEGTLVGVGSCAIPGIKVGSWSVIGAGSVMVKDIPDGVTAYGVPATTKCSHSLLTPHRNATR